MVRDTHITDMTEHQEQGMPVVTSAEFQRNLGFYQDKALTEPVTITKNGREWLVLLSVEEYARLKRRDRRVFSSEDVADEQLAAIGAVEMSGRHRHLDDELKDWNP
jgi:prevent-host-death family protein